MKESEALEGEALPLLQGLRNFSYISFELKQFLLLAISKLIQIESNIDEESEALRAGRYPSFKVSRNFHRYFIRLELVLKSYKDREFC